MNKLLYALLTYTIMFNGHIEIMAANSKEPTDTTQLNIAQKPHSNQIVEFDRSDDYTTLENKILSLAKQAATAEKPAQRLTQLIQENKINLKDIISVINNIRPNLQNLGYEVNTIAKNNDTTVNISYKKKNQTLLHAEDANIALNKNMTNQQAFTIIQGFGVLLNKQLEALNKIITYLDTKNLQTTEQTTLSNTHQGRYSTISEIIPHIKPLYQHCENDTEVLIAFVNDIKLLAEKYLPFIQTLKSEYGNLSISDLLGKYTEKQNVTKIGNFENSSNTDAYTRFLEKKAEERRRELNAMRGTNSSNKDTIVQRMSKNYSAAIRDEQKGKFDSSTNGILKRNTEDSAYNMIKQNNLGNLRYDGN